jgi:hypothetical protein
MRFGFMQGIFNELISSWMINFMLQKLISNAVLVLLDDVWKQRMHCGELVLRRLRTQAILARGEV